MEITKKGNTAKQQQINVLFVSLHTGENSFYSIQRREETLITVGHVTKVLANTSSISGGLKSKPFQILALFQRTKQPTAFTLFILLSGLEHSLSCKNDIKWGWTGKVNPCIDRTNNIR